MKRIFFTLATTLFLAAGLQAQTVFMSTDQTEVCIYNQDTDAFEDCQMVEEPSLFTLDQSETAFTHTTAEMSSSYHVKSRQYNVDDKTWEYAVVSDVGNQYVFIVAPQKRVIKIVGTRRTDKGQKQYYIVAHHISKTWKEAETVGMTSDVQPYIH